MLDELPEELLLELLEKLDDRLLSLDREVLELDEFPRLEEELLLDDLVLDELLDLVDDLDEDLVLELDSELELLGDDALDRLLLVELDFELLRLVELSLLGLLDAEVLVFEPLLLVDERISHDDVLLELRLESPLSDELELLLELDDLVELLDAVELPLVAEVDELLDCELLKLEDRLDELLETLDDCPIELPLVWLDSDWLLLLELCEDAELCECPSLELDLLVDSDEPELTLVALTYSDELFDDEFVLLELSLLLDELALLLDDDSPPELTEVLLEELELLKELEELELLCDSENDELDRLERLVLL